MKTILESVLSQIKPDSKERAKLTTLAEGIIHRINHIAKKEELDVKAELVGSSARGTWLSGEHDLDIFIMFPPDMERKQLEEKGLYIARKIAQEADAWEERYAEHPYIHAIFDGCEVDLVPAFRVRNACNIKSAVDRTPFHNNYVSSRIKGLEDEVLLLKQFMKAIKVYGSELKTHGFSGYLAELLIIHYGSFLNTLKAACRWKKGITIDIEAHGTKHEAPMIVIDPIDCERNVAASLSLDNLCIFIDKACEFLKNPSESYFKEEIPQPLSDEEYQNILEKRGTSVLAIEFEAPNVVEDVLFPQLHKLEESAKRLLEHYDFKVYNSEVWAKDKAIILFELESEQLPAVKKHQGPQVWARKHSLAFKSKYQKTKRFSNIYIKNGRYMVEIPRRYVHAKKLVNDKLTSCALGKHVALSIKKEYHVLKDNEILELKDNEFRCFLRKFFEK